jgi:hypothetical protein
MSMYIDESFVRDYRGDFVLEYQRESSLLRNAVRWESGIRGYSTTFQRIGAGVATTKGRHAVIPPMNQDHTPVTCTLQDFYAGDFVDRLDELKIKHNERRAIARGGAAALGRKIDEQIFEALDSTTTTGVTISLTSEATVRNGLMAMLEALWSNDVPNDGQIYAALSPRLWAAASVVEEFASSDYVGTEGQVLRTGAPTGGRWKMWNGALWTMHTGLPGKGTSAAKSYAWHKPAVGYASGQDPIADVTWHGDRAAHFINHMMSGGACLIDANGVVEGTSDDTAAIPSS